MTDAGSGTATRATRGGIPLLLSITSALVLFATQSRDLGNVYDEGLILLEAQRVLEGDLPYRDFWAMYAPGQFYVLAGLFKLFGSAILVERAWDVAIRAGLAAMAFLWARRLGAGGYSYAAWLAVLVLLAGFGNHGFPVPHAVLFALVSGHLVLDGLEQPRPARRLFAAGVAAGIAALFRHDLGFYAVLAEALLLAWWAPRRLIATLIPLALGAGLIVGAAAIFLLAQMPLRDLWFNLVAVPATIYPRVRALPFPPFPDPRALFRDGTALRIFNDGVDAYLPLLAAAAALAWLAVTSRSDTQDGLRRAGILLLVLFTLTFYLKGIVRTHDTHLIQSVIPAVVLVAVLLAHMRARPVAITLGAIVAIMLLVQPARIALTALADNIATLRAVRSETGLRLGIARLCAPPPGLNRARCFQPRPDDVRSAQLIQSHTGPDEPIYVGVTRHDRIFVNNILLQYIMARPAATKWHELHPGIQTTAAVQSEMIAELIARNVRYLVLSAEWVDLREPNESAVSSGVTLLDDHIRANFEETDKFGAVSIWRRR